MFKSLLSLCSILALANAGYLSEPVALPAYPAYHAPVLAAPIVKAAVPVATSYQNQVQISAAAVPVAAPVVAPVYKAAPVIAAPALHYPAPAIHYPAPAIVKSPLFAAPLPYALH